MPKQPGGITKFQRIEALRDAITRAGKLNKHQIDERVATLLACSAEDISRSLYRDLEELERLGQIQAVRFTRDGQKIDDYDPETHKNTICEWSLVGLENTIRGAKRLKDFGAEIHSTSRLTRNLILDDGKASFSELKEVVSKAEKAAKISSSDRRSSIQKLAVFFWVGGKVQCLNIESEALPIQLCVARAESGLKAPQILEESGVLGKRAVLLLVPFAGVSRYRDSKKPGHLVVQIDNGEFAQVLDLDSKNGSFYSELSENQALQLIKKRSSTGSRTMTVMVDTSTGLKINRIQRGTQVRLRLPLHLFASPDFECFISAI